MIKTTVGEFRKFLDADYGAEDDGWFEEVTFYRDGSDEPVENDDDIFAADIETAMAPSEPIRFEGGVIVFPNEKRRKPLDVEPLFRRWRKEQTHSHVLVLLPNEHFEELKAAVKAMGGQVVH